MAGPWDKYAATPDSGPWSKYGQAQPQDTPQPQVPQGTISAVPKPQGVQATVSDWLNKLESDVRHGGTETLPGKLLNKLGARGTDMGVSPDVANMVASPVLGPIKTAQGVAEGSPLKTLGGIAQTASLPSAFVAPEASESVINKIPSRNWGGKAIQVVEQAAKDANLSVSPDSAGPIAMRIKEVANAGTTLPAPVRSLVNRVTKLAGKGPITFQEARDIYSNATQKLSAEDAMSLAPKMKFFLGQFARALNQDITAAATTIGKGPMYQEAMQNYAQASKIIGGAQKIGSAAAKAGAVGAGIGGVYELSKKLGR